MRRVMGYLPPAMVRGLLIWGGREVNPCRVSELRSSWLCSSTGASLNRVTMMSSSKLGTSECSERHTLLGVFNNKLCMLFISHPTLGSAVFRVDMRR